MKRFGPVALLVLTIAALAVPTASAKTTYTFVGQSSARALDLALPALRVIPTLAQQFKGSTVGATWADFSSSPSIKGQAAARCDLLPSNTGPGGSLPCAAGSTEDSASNGTTGDGAAKCEAPVNLVAVVNLNASCGNSVSKVEGGRVAGKNQAGVGELRLSLDMSQLSTAIEQNKDSVVDTLSGVVNEVFKQAKAAPIPQDKQEALKAAIGDFLNSLKQGGQFGFIKAGLSTTDVTQKDANSLLVTSQAAGVSIGLLGLTNALQDGLVIIEVSVAKVTAEWNADLARATATATPAVATVKVRDLINLDPASDYLSVAVTAPQLNSLLSSLNGTILETTLTVAQATASPPGLNVTASTTGVSLHAIKGLGESAAGARDGGISLRVAVAGVAFSAAPAPLPATGGPTYLFLGAAAILAAGAPFVYRLSRKLHQAR